MQLLSRLADIVTAEDTLSDGKEPFIEERSVDESRPVRVVVIGSGISGIITSVRFRQRIPNLDLCVYERNADIGGTWFENRYPGCACGMLLYAFQSFLFPLVSFPFVLTWSRHTGTHIPGHFRAQQSMVRFLCIIP